MRSNEFVKVVLHLLKHSISQRIQLAAEGIVDGVDFTGGSGRAQLLSVVRCDVLKVLAHVGPFWLFGIVLLCNFRNLDVFKKLCRDV